MLYLAAVEFFEDPDNYDLVLRGPLERWFKDALVRFDQQGLLANVGIEHARITFTEARAHVRLKQKL